MALGKSTDICRQSDLFCLAKLQTWVCKEVGWSVEDFCFGGWPQAEAKEDDVIRPLISDNLDAYSGQIISIVAVLSVNPYFGK